MKQKDLVTIIAIVFFSAVFSYIISGKIFVTPTARQQSVEVVPAIPANFPQADSKYFNSQANDPTEPFDVGTNNNTAPPFTASTQ